MEELTDTEKIFIAWAIGYVKGRFALSATDDLSAESILKKIKT